MKKVKYFFEPLLFYTYPIVIDGKDVVAIVFLVPDPNLI